MKVNEKRQIQCRDGQGVVVFSFEISLKVEIKTGAVVMRMRTSRVSCIYLSSSSEYYYCNINY